MRSLTLTEIELAVRGAFDADTCDPDDLPGWHPANASRGQSAAAALVVNDLLGGELVFADVMVDGVRTGGHWWNLFGVVEVDITRDQYSPEEIVVGGTVVTRPAGPPTRGLAQYELLRRRTFERLGLLPAPVVPEPVPTGLPPPDPILD